MICSVSAAALPSVPDLHDPATACPVDIALTLLRAAAAGSCGREVFCREGTRQLQEILTDLTEGKGRSDDLELIEELCSATAQQAPCELAGEAAARTLGLLADHREEWEQHLRRKRCTSLTCTMAFTVYIDPAACTSSGGCAPVCPEAAIVGGPGEIHVVLADRCTKCLACFAACPNGAIHKAGPVKPRLPEHPIPVGSFAGSADGGGMRRRRRGSQ
jgi:ferredoxin